MASPELTGGRGGVVWVGIKGVVVCVCVFMEGGGGAGGNPTTHSRSLARPPRPAGLGFSAFTARYVRAWGEPGGWERGFLGSVGGEVWCGWKGVGVRVSNPCYSATPHCPVIHVLLPVAPPPLPAYARHRCKHARALPPPAPHAARWDVCTRRRPCRAKKPPQVNMHVPTPPHRAAPWDVRTTPILADEAACDRMLATTRAELKVRLAFPATCLPGPSCAFWRSGVG
jgi:hypothetical protein